jgi:hypothetical protein
MKSYGANFSLHKCTYYSHILPPSLYVCRPGNVFVRETRFSRDKHLGTEGVLQYIINTSVTVTQLLFSDGCSQVVNIN